MYVPPEDRLHAEGCLLGQLAGDSLGSLVEFQSPEQIFRKYPDGIRELADGGTWGTIAGQPTDDSEMALMLARMLMKNRRYDAEEARKAYIFWLNWATEMAVEKSLMKAILDAADQPPIDYLTQQGWVIIAFQNALWQLLHAKTLEEGVVDTVMRGGDTDTNAAIAGALLGAVYGREAVPKQWVEKLLTCRPESGQPNVRHPRPQCFWPVDALHIAFCLAAGGESQ